MKRKMSEDKLLEKRQALLARTMKVLAVDKTTAQQLLSTERAQSIRINTLKPSVATHKPGWLGTQYEWMSTGYTLRVSVAEVRDDEQVLQGNFFIQNAASWLPVLALDPHPGEMILDICAAPGGKTSHIAAVTGNKAVIWANDNSRPRLAKLQSNMERLGASIANYTLYDATQLARKLDGRWFDRILLDAPCSGEGLMNITNDKDLATWSVAHIKRLQQLQKRIITQAWQLLKPGGTLVYSTCTMAPEENEAVIDYVLRTRPDAHVMPFSLDLPNAMPPLTQWNGKPFSQEVAGALRLKPSTEIEAFFVCVLRKDAHGTEPRFVL